PTLRAGLCPPIHFAPLDTPPETAATRGEQVCLDFDADSRSSRVFAIFARAVSRDLLDWPANPQRGDQRRSPATVNTVAVVDASRSTAILRYSAEVAQRIASSRSLNSIRTTF